MNDCNGFPKGDLKNKFCIQSLHFFGLSAALRIWETLIWNFSKGIAILASKCWNVGVKLSGKIGLSMSLKLDPSFISLFVPYLERLFSVFWSLLGWRSKCLAFGLSLPDWAHCDFANLGVIIHNSYFRNRWRWTEALCDWWPGSGRLRSWEDERQVCDSGLRRILRRHFLRRRSCHCVWTGWTEAERRWTHSDHRRTLAYKQNSSHACWSLVWRGF